MDVEPCQQIAYNVKKMIFCVLVKNQEAIRMKRKTLQYIRKDDEYER